MKDDLVHPGTLRICYDPLHQHWLAWWTCCGCGNIVDVVVGKQEERKKEMVEGSNTAVSDGATAGVA